jgi:hypothetical protein
MTGHQATFWHAGILAKYMAVDALAHTLNGTRVTVTVDHDVSSPLRLVLPTTELKNHTVTLSPAATREGTPDCYVDEVDLGALKAALAANISFPTGVRIGAGLIAGALEETAGAQAASQAAHVTRALNVLMRPYVEQPDVMYTSSGLAHLPGFWSLIAEMHGDAQRCVECYNQAARAHPRARIAPLRVERGRVQLPLWWLDPHSKARTEVYSSDNITEGGGRILAPRALTLSAFCRLSLCDLFIHGRGGGSYDAVTNDWFAAWRPGYVLAPGAVVSASCYVTFPALPPLPTPAEVADAWWRAHRARHDRGGGGESLSEEKRGLLRIVADAPKGPLRRAAYVRLQEWLRSERQANKDFVRGLVEAATRLSTASEGSEVAFGRTYAFSLLEEATLRSLRESLWKSVAAR